MQFAFNSEKAWAHEQGHTLDALGMEFYRHWCDASIAVNAGNNPLEAIARAKEVYMRIKEIKVNTA